MPRTSTLAYDYGSSSSPGNVISRVAGLTLDSSRIVNYEHVGAGLVTLVDYAVPDVQLDRTLSADGKRRFDTYTTQAAGVYPGLDRFGRIARQVWADGSLTTHGSLGTVPNRPPIVETGYTYDRAGSRTAALDLRPGNQWKMSWEYEYDGLHRLTVADRGKWNGSSLTSLAGGQQWTLDPLGNWDQWKFDADFSGSFSAAETEDRSHNGVNELLDRNQGTGGTDETLTYDLAGNLRTRVANSVTTTYTHDAWNRLVKVVVGSATVLEQEHNGLSWRTWKRADTNANGTLDEERTFAYDPSWRLVEERVDADYPTRPGLDRRVQHVWGKRYIDDAVLHRRDGNNDGDYLDANEGTWYHLTDAMYSTVALFSGASVVERVTYTPYGEARHHFGNDVNGDGGTDASDQAIVLGAWGTTIGNAGYLAEADLNRDGSIGSADLSIVLSYATALAPGLISNASPTGPDSTSGWDGYVFNPETRLYTVRHRSYLPVLGRWMERDPLGNIDSQNLFEAMRGGPIVRADPLGLFSMNAVLTDRPDPCDTWRHGGRPFQRERLYPRAADCAARNGSLESCTSCCYSYWTGGAAPKDFLEACTRACRRAERGRAVDPCVDPDHWRRTKKLNNCFNFMTNTPGGQVAPRVDGWTQDCDSMRRALLQEGAVEPLKCGECPPGHYRFWYYRKSGGGMHFIRRDCRSEDRYWHIPGTGEDPTDLDYERNPLRPSPELHDRRFPGNPYLRCGDLCWPAGLRKP